MHLLLKRIQSCNKIVKPLIFIVLVASVFLVLFLVKKTSEYNSFEHEIQIKINNTITLKTDVSTTNKERMIGLSKYEKLSEDQAMLFVFEKKGFYSFWMRDMKFPIDIIWLDENKTIVSIKENADPVNFPQSYTPESESLFVVETVAGFVQKNNLEKGQQFFW